MHWGDSKGVKIEGECGRKCACVLSLHVSSIARFPELEQHCVSKGVDESHGVVPKALLGRMAPVTWCRYSYKSAPCPSKKILEPFLPAKKAMQLWSSVGRREHQENAV